MDLGLAGKRVLVTGGSKGIGLAVGDAFAAEGCHVTLVSRSADSLKKAADGLRARHQVPIEFHAADLSSGPDREGTAARYAVDTDILVNNAGAIPGGSLFDISMERWQEAWNLKLLGYIHMTKLFLKPMSERKSGTIINIVGMAAKGPRWDYICGATANMALNTFTYAVGGKASEWGVRVFGINPAATRTDRIFTLAKSRAKTMFGDEGRWEEALGDLPFGRLKEPAEVAALAAMLASNKVEYLSGTVIDMDGGAQYRGK